MTQKNDMKKGKQLPEKPETDSLEKEIEKLISKEQTRRTIVSKLLSQPNSKFKKSDK